MYNASKMGLDYLGKHTSKFYDDRIRGTYYGDKINRGMNFANQYLYQPTKTIGSKVWNKTGQKLFDYSLKRFKNTNYYKNYFPTPTLDEITIGQLGQWDKMENMEETQEQIQLMEQMQQLQQRLEQEQVHLGKLNFTLSWHNLCDLDLHVTCPCGTHIYHGHRKCDSCGGYLDLDMNYQVYHQTAPIEHIYFDNPVIGQYSIFMNNCGQRSYNGNTSPGSADYKLWTHFGSIVKQTQSGSLKEGQTGPSHKVFYNPETIIGKQLKNRSIILQEFTRPFDLRASEIQLNIDQLRLQINS